MFDCQIKGGYREGKMRKFFPPKSSSTHYQEIRISVEKIAKIAQSKVFMNLSTLIITKICKLKKISPPKKSIWTRPWVKFLQMLPCIVKRLQ